MATYQDIKGLRVKYLSADPSPTTQGEVWYNSTSGTLKATVIGTASWASGGSLSNPFHGGNSSFGSTPAGAHVGGTIPTGYISGKTELYDGTAWTANPNLCPVSIGYGTGGGPQTAGIICSGESPPGSGTATIKFDGSAWTSAPSRSTSRQNATGIGTQTSFIQVGGAWSPSWTALTVNETFNGASWSTEPNSYPATNEQGFAGGTAAAAVIGGGIPPTPLGAPASNTWDGSAWTAAPVMLSARYNGAWAGTSTDAFQIGGYNSPSGGFTDTTVFDGTTWAATASTATGTSGGSGAGFTGGPGGVIKMGGSYGTATTCEEFNAAAAETQTLTTS